MAARVLVTRPVPQGERTAERLIALGYVPILAPMLRIEHLPAPSWLNFDAVQAIAVTSSNGVEALASVISRRDQRCFVVGEKTAETARRLGFREVISAGGTAQSLADLINDHVSPGRGPVLHARGKDVAVSLSALLDPTIECAEAVLYQATSIPHLPPDAQDPVPEAALVYSARTGEALADALRGSEARFDRMSVIGISRAALKPLESLVLASLIAADAPNEDAIFVALRDAFSAVKKI